MCSFSHADKTLMWLTDWYQGNLDSAEINSVYIAHYGDTGTASQGYYFGKADLMLSATNAYAPFIKVNSEISNTGKPDSLKVPKLLSRYWYAQPKFSTGNFRGGMVNVEMNFSYFNHRFQSGPPPSMHVDSSSKGHGQTGQLNQSSSDKPGFLDNCISSTYSDTVWIRVPSNDSTINPGYVGNSLACTDHNPFFVNVGTIHVYNPWPGKSLYVQQGNAWYPMFPEVGRLGWQTTTLWADPRGDTSFKVRIASGKPGGTSVGVQYMDLSGFATSSSGPAFDFSSKPHSEQWIMPPVSPTSKPVAVTSAPALKTVLMIQRPDWSSAAVRVLWKGNDARFIAGSTQYCNWFALPLYDGAIPDSIVLQHPMSDTLYGTMGLAKTPSPMSAFANWIALKGKITGDTTWITSPKFPGASIVPRPATQLSSCDTKILAFSAYDYADGLDASSPYFYAPFAEVKSGVNYTTGQNKGKVTDNCPDAGGGATKGLVKTALNAQGRPVWSGKVDCDIGSAQHGPQNWYDPLTIAGTRMNAYKCVPLTLTLDPKDGYYKYSKSDFFPLNQATSVPYGPANGNNFHFAMHSKASFEYVRGLNFKFKGDDDVWVFIDKKLALDLGGMHGEMAGEIDLDKLNLVEGKSYQFDMFYSERHQTGSNIGIQTTMNLVPTIDVVFDTAGSSGSLQDVKIKTIETSNDPSVCPEDGATTTQKELPGRAGVFLISPDGTQEEVDTLKYRDAGLVITDLFSHIAIDTVKLQKSGLFVQSGLYQILITIGTESRQVDFSIVTKNIDAHGVLLDRDGDGRPDSVFVHGDGISPAFARSFEAVLNWADNAGIADSARITGTAIAAGPGDTTASGIIEPQMTFRTSCPPDGCVGKMGRVWAIASNGDTVKNRLVELQDGIAPVADSAWLIYDSTGLGQDTLYVRASEALSRYAGTVDLPAATSAWSLLGSSALPRLLPAAASVRGNLLAIPLDPATNPVEASDSLRLGGYAADGLDNAPGVLSRWVPIASKPRVRAWMLDADGDGTPDSVVLSSKGDLGTIRSLKVQWKTADGLDTILNISTPTGVKLGVKLPPNTLQNATFCRGCLVEITSADGTPSTANLADSVAAVAVKASLITAGNGDPDTLDVQLSEGITLYTLDLLRLSTDSAGTATSIAPTAILSANLSGTRLRLIVASQSVSDQLGWLRLAAGVKDSSGAAVGSSSRWVRLKIRPSGSASLFDSDGDGRADSVSFTVRGSIASLNVTQATLTWKDSLGRTTSRVWSLEGKTGSSFGLHPADPTQWFPFGATSCPGSACTIALGDLEWPLLDKVAPIVTSGIYRFGKGTAPDTLRAAFSEAMQTISGDPVWIEYGNGTALSGSALHSYAELTPSLDTALLLIPANVVPSNEVRSIRLACAALSGKLSDRNGSLAGATSPWAALRYGIPPVTVVVKDPTGKGRPDQLTIRTTRKVPVQALVLDSAQVFWSNATGDGLEPRTVRLSSLPLDTIDQSWTISLSSPLPLGATGCNVVGCGALVGNGEEWTGVTLIDSAAPVAMNATLSYSPGDVAKDTLRIVLSETSTIPAVALCEDLAQVGIGAQLRNLKSPFNTCSLSDDGLLLTMILDTTVSDAFTSGDSVWLTSLVADALGNRPGPNTRRAPLQLGMRPVQVKIGTWPPLLINKGETAWPPPATGTPQFEILVRPLGSGQAWQTVESGAIQGRPINDTSHLTGMLVTLNRPLSGMMYVYDQLGISVGKVDLSDLAKAWKSPSNTAKDQVQQVWIGWNGTNANRQFAASGVYLLRLVALIETEPGKTQLRNLVQKVGWQREK